MANRHRTQPGKWRHDLAVALSDAHARNGCSVFVFDLAAGAEERVQDDGSIFSQFMGNREGLCRNLKTVRTGDYLIPVRGQMKYSGSRLRNFFNQRDTQWTPNGHQCNVRIPDSLAGGRQDVN